MKTTTIKLHLVLGALCLPASLASAAVLLTDDFESYTVGNNVTTGGNWANINTAGGSLIVRDQNTATPFGSPNRYLEFVDSSNLSLRLQSQTYPAASNALTTLSFDFYEPDTGGSSMNIGYAINNLDLTSANRRQNITLNNGFIGSVTLASTGSNRYSLDTAYTLYMIFNDTAATVDYQGGSIAADFADVWLRNISTGILTYVGTSASENTATNETSYSVAFRCFNDNIQDIFFDNVSLIEGAAAIPEPSAALLGGLGLLALLRRKRT